MSRTLIIAEAGVNHNGSAQMALELVDAAAAAGADIVKFQTFRADALVSRDAPKAEYQKRETGAGQSQWEMLRDLELSPDLHRQLIARCQARGIGFLSTPFDLHSLAFLVDELGLRQIKVGSGDLNNAPLLHAAARRGVKIILSTGMATVEDIATALGMLAHGYGSDDTAPTTQAAAAAYADPVLRDKLCHMVSLLHCTTNYPAAYDTVNLRAIDHLRDTFGLPVGLSDHTVGIAVAIASTAFSVPIIEKHFTLDRTLPGPDHSASLTPDELADLVRGVRAVEQALGDGRKQPFAVEREIAAVARKSLMASRPIRAGEIYTPDNLTTKRPGTGICALRFFDLIGRRAARDYKAEELIDPAETP